MRYQFIKENRDVFSVMKMGQTLNVHTSGYYRWLKSPCSPRKREDAQIRARIKELFHEHNEKAGSHMIAADMRAEPACSSVSKIGLQGIYAIWGYAAKQQRNSWLQPIPGIVNQLLQIY